MQLLIIDLHINMKRSICSTVEMPTTKPKLIEGWWEEILWYTIWRIQVLKQNQITKTMFGLLFFIAQFPALNFRHSSHITHYSLLITYHSKYPTRLALSLSCHHSIFFTLFVSSIPVTRCRKFFFFFIQYHRTQWKKKEKKEKKRKWRPNQWHRTQ